MQSDLWTALGTWAAVVLTVVSFGYAMHRNRTKAAADAMESLRKTLTSQITRVGADVDNLEIDSQKRFGDLDRTLRVMEREAERTFVTRIEFERYIKASDETARRIESSVSGLGMKIDDLNKYLRDSAAAAAVQSRNGHTRR